MQIYSPLLSFLLNWITASITGVVYPINISIIIIKWSVSSQLPTTILSSHVHFFFSPSPRRKKVHSLEAWNRGTRTRLRLVQVKPIHYRTILMFFSGAHQLPVWIISSQTTMCWWHGEILFQTAAVDAKGSCPSIKKRTCCPFGTCWSSWCGRQPTVSV